MPLRIPHRLLPLCLRVVRATSGAALRLHDVLERVHGGLREMHVGKHGSMCRRCFVAVPCGDDICDDCIPAFYRKVTRPRVCIDCGTSEPNGLCDSCAVLGTGRLPS